ncbi:MbtH family protein [Micromonospora sp. AKA38]|uniref:MbtH family protein n=1 Tax=Micromonospora sp. AKA38 TaxID=2733861 RepID=UPI0022BC6E7E|nr:MbtH family NRPS accessory protein [Micromonospora sp. AKA38]GHJ15506.1 hypothetical protein TPA0908_35010 [Micromonospora sp. AKA38]
MTQQEADVYQVVLNDEQQYSIWPAHQTPPDGWREVGTSGTEDECLAHIENVWRDMRPLTLRRHMGS